MNRKPICNAAPIIAKILTIYSDKNLCPASMSSLEIKNKLINPDIPSDTYFTIVNGTIIITYHGMNTAKLYPYIANIL